MPSGGASTPSVTDGPYRVRTLDDGIVHIQEPYVPPFCRRCNIWFVPERLRGLLVDTGSGLVSLCEQVACLGERPVLAVATHRHFDHIGLHHEFGERAVHPSEARYLVESDRETVLIEPYATTEMFSALPPGAFDRWTNAVLPVPTTGLIEDGDTLDVGDRRFDVIHTPWHSPGSIALWEEASGALFSGDNGSPGPAARSPPSNLSRLPSSSSA